VGVLSDGPDASSHRHCPAYGRDRAAFKALDASQGESRLGAVQSSNRNPKEQNMKAMVDLFSTDYGLFSIGVIAFMLGMAVWFYRFFMRKMDESQRNQG
jgi:hypothetical protein